MLGIDLVRPLEEGWREVLDAVGRARGWPTGQDARTLGAHVAALSAAYNDPARARAPAREAGAARLGFSFPRDVPKGAAATRELLAVGAIPREADLHVLDLGAGLGAMTWGLVRAREALGGKGAIDATWVDADAEALDVAQQIVGERARRVPRGAAPRVTPVRAAVSPASPLPREARGPFDVVLAGHVLSEMDRGLAPGPRAEAHAAWLGRLLCDAVAPGGSLVVVEPALRDRTRHLHRVRDALLCGPSGATVFAPCTHAARCPALADERDWCHEDLRVDLPSWLVPVARAAGLRHEGLTFSYLVLRRDGTTIASAQRASPGEVLLRVVSDRIKSKGKLEVFLCGDFAAQGARAPARVRAARLDRDAGDANVAWGSLARGDVVALGAALDRGRPRIGESDRVRVL
jgi:SAM-dependent methyltransferase